MVEGGWYSVRFYAIARPQEVGFTVQLFLHEPMEVRNRTQWKRLVPRLKRLEGEGRWVMPKFVRNYLDRYVNRFPGVYSVGPFDTKALAVLGWLDMEDWWRANAHKFLGLEGVGQVVPEDRGEEGDHLQETRTKAMGVLDVTDPDHYLRFPSVKDASQTLGLPRAKIVDVCRGRRASYAGRVLRYEDPGGYGIPVVPRDGRFVEDRETISRGKKRPPTNPLPWEK